ncbi:MAG: gas vesicle protein [Deltaproteobacteria bacterium]|nr:gas vesicle protein [Deltaproteobacteria bacterium]
MPAASVALARPRLRPSRALACQRRVSLCETLDRVLNKGAVVAGDIVISVADVDLLYVGVNLVVSSVETMRRRSAACS